MSILSFFFIVSVILTENCIVSDFILNQGLFIDFFFIRLLTEGWSFYLTRETLDIWNSFILLNII